MSVMESERIERERAWAPSSAKHVADGALRVAGRVALLASADRELRRRVSTTLDGLRWQVLQAAGGAELFAMMESGQAAVGTVLLDSWLPDLEVRECVLELARQYPKLDVMALDGTDIGAAPLAGSYRNEILHALRLAQQSDEAAWVGAQSASEIVHGNWNARRSENEDRAPSLPESQGRRSAESLATSRLPASGQTTHSNTGGALARSAPVASAAGARSETRSQSPAVASITSSGPGVPEMLGRDPRMLEVTRRILLVAPRSTAVLVQGPTGTGKELVARALHRLSPRAAKPFIVLNCAAIPEALLEAELFGHSRGAFTGAVQRRTGRLEAAHGGTLFLDEIGELPLALQAKLLRFVECGELQRVGENEPIRVDVRIIAATHRKLGQMAAAGAFRADLYYRLSVFLIKTPALVERTEDIVLLAQNALARMARSEPAKTLAPGALARLISHPWPGNVRELEHTLERSWILAAHRRVIEADDIDFCEETDD